ncbi:stage III sporulation protein AG [Candidatus Contubernalis alkaliaceticus]|uniref:stage III sporulation protein AG n=1 Tax=Candidatus Contubernalis alkaliaceticus TaxID=338645 RepID=UPI001F4BD8FE|nr:stage III sporulation protein AG [Candidatus Contubernalis alkalaceticus]UNC92551.1 stage III sporulation protein AG [Candidatus Contubernalis alkalaceticus]
MSAFWEKLKNNFIFVQFCSPDKKNEQKMTKQKKDLRWILILLAGALLMMFSSFFTNNTDKSPSETVNWTEEEALSVFANKQDSQEEKMEKDLENILGEIEGVSDVSVMISFYAGSKYIYAANYEENIRQTEERDKDGGSRDIMEENHKDNIVLRRGENGEEIPLIIEEIHPEVQGVLVVARGVEQPIKKSQIVEAVKTILDLPYHKVVVLPRGR